MNAPKVDDVLSLEEVFKNTLELLEKQKATGLILNWAV